MFTNVQITCIGAVILHAVDHALSRCGNGQNFGIYNCEAVCYKMIYLLFYLLHLYSVYFQTSKVNCCTSIKQAYIFTVNQMTVHILKLQLIELLHHVQYKTVTFLMHITAEKQQRKQRNTKCCSIYYNVIIQQNYNTIIFSTIRQFQLSNYAHFQV